jgi:hypothetical protein
MRVFRCLIKSRGVVHSGSYEGTLECADLLSPQKRKPVCGSGCRPAVALDASEIAFCPSYPANSSIFFFIMFVPVLLCCCATEVVIAIGGIRPNPSANHCISNCAILTEAPACHQPVAARFISLHIPNPRRLQGYRAAGLRHPWGSAGFKLEY